MQYFQSLSKMSLALCKSLPKPQCLCKYYWIKNGIFLYTKKLFGLTNLKFCKMLPHILYISKLCGMLCISFADPQQSIPIHNAWSLYGSLLHSNNFVYGHKTESAHYFWQKLGMELTVGTKIIVFFNNQLFHTVIVSTSICFSTGYRYNLEP